jgi:hypothetical protein
MFSEKTDVYYLGVCATSFKLTKELMCENLFADVNVSAE